jgi:hypothetical protein
MCFFWSDVLFSLAGGLNIFLTERDGLREAQCRIRGSESEGLCVSSPYPIEVLTLFQ